MGRIRLRTLAAPAALAAGLVVAGCGDTTGERAISGGAIGAAGGAAAGAVTGGSVGTGALLGGAAGAAAGALTDRDDLDLGDPIIDLD
ncbi:MAG: YMGG-like glycine zipper-containing protein [Pseudomonadota bacterium]